MQNLKIIKETNHFLVIQKPVNIPSQADKTGDIDCITLIKEYLRKKYNKVANIYVGLVHRLDRPVGGVMVFAKTSKGASRLSKSIQEGKFIKEYILVADGKFEKSDGIMEDYLLKDEHTNLSKVVEKNTKNSKLAKLEYHVLSYREDNNLSLVHAKLYTGRHHQIRVQFAARNHSLYGDQKYGTRGKGKQIALFAFRLSFPDPITKDYLTFSAYPEINGTWSMLKNIKL